MDNNQTATTFPASTRIVFTALDAETVGAGINANIEQINKRLNEELQIRLNPCHVVLAHDHAERNVWIKAHGATDGHKVFGDVYAEVAARVADWDTEITVERRNEDGAWVWADTIDTEGRVFVDEDDLFDWLAEFTGEVTADSEWSATIGDTTVIRTIGNGISPQ